MTYVTKDGRLLVYFAALQWLNIVTESARVRCSHRFWNAVVCKFGESWWIAATDAHRIHAVKIRNVGDFEPMSIDTLAALTRRPRGEHMIDVGPFSEKLHADAPKMESYICADDDGLPDLLTINLEYLTDACWLAVNHVVHPEGVSMSRINDELRPIRINGGGDWIAIIMPMLGTTEKRLGEE